MTSSQGGYAYETLADGSPIPKFDDQSPKTPFALGKIMTLGNIIYGYSGMVNFDITAANSYPLIRFTLERNGMLRATFNCDWNVIQATNSDVGIQISVDGQSTIRQVWDIGGSGANRGGYRGPWTVEFFVPAGRDCNIVVLNPDNGADLLQANVTMVGQYV